MVRQRDRAHGFVCQEPLVAVAPVIRGVGKEDLDRQRRESTRSAPASRPHCPRAAPLYDWPKDGRVVRKAAGAFQTQRDRPCDESNEPLSRGSVRSVGVSRSRPLRTSDVPHTGRRRGSTPGTTATSGPTGLAAPGRRSRDNGLNAGTGPQGRATAPRFCAGTAVMLNAETPSGLSSAGRAHRLRWDRSRSVLVHRRQWPCSPQGLRPGPGPEGWWRPTCRHRTLSPPGRPAGPRCR